MNYRYVGYRPDTDNPVIVRARLWMTIQGEDVQRHWLNPLLNIVCRVTGWNYYWYRTSLGGRRYLRIGDMNR